MITAEQARELLEYSAETGIMTWKKGFVTTTKPSRIGKVAGYKMKIGYRTIPVAGERYYAHRLAWLLHYGEWPSGEVDHINGVKDDNRLCNLRMATGPQNKANRPKQRNNTSGRKGVHWHKKARKWMVSVQVNGKQIYGGLFSDLEIAHAEYVRMSTLYYGDFAHP